MSGILLRRSSKQEATELAERQDAEGAFVLWLVPGGGIRTAFHGTPEALTQIAPLLRQMADDVERKQGIVRRD